VAELYRRGIFKVTGAIDIAAKTMGISRYTLYNYIREARFGKHNRVFQPGTSKHQ